MDDQRHDEVGSGSEPRSARLSRRQLLMLGGAGLAGLIGVWRLERGVAKPLRSVTEPSRSVTSSALADFPVLNVEGGPPRIAARDWVLSLDGLVDRPLRLDRAAWLALPRTQKTLGLHCVEGWSVENLRWEGVRVKDLLGRVVAQPEAQFVSFHAYGGTYANSLTLAEALAPEALLADRLNGVPLPAAHGGPLRLVVPTGLGYKNVKWVTRVEVAAQPHNLP